MLRSLLWCLIVACLSAGEALVDRAARDPSQAVALLRQGSEQLAQAGAGDLAVQADALDQLARRVFLNGWRVPGRESLGLVSRSVVAGDSLSRLGKQAGVPHELVLRLNPGLDPRRLAIGARVMVFDAATTPLRLDVRLAQHRLLVWRGPILVLACPVGVGASASPTPAGRTRITVRAKNPEWRDPQTGTVHPPGSPGNLLGGYWLGFDPGPDRRFASIGCHGWTGGDPATWLNTGGSRGCLRLRQVDIVDLYDLLLPGTVVDIR